MVIGEIYLQQVFLQLIGMITQRLSGGEARRFCGQGFTGGHFGRFVGDFRMLFAGDFAGDEGGRDVLDEDVVRAGGNFAFFLP